MPGAPHKPFAVAERLGRAIGLDPEIDAESACALMGVKLEDLVAELNYRHRRKLALLHQEMAQVAKVHGETRVLRCRGGDGGYVDLNIHPASYHYWGQRLGYECWQDAQFLREYKRDNPASVVRVVTKTVIVKPELVVRPPAAARVRRRGRWGL